MMIYSINAGTRLIKKGWFAAEVLTAKNGKEGLSYFFRPFCAKTNTEGLPQIIFLDLNMP